MMSRMATKAKSCQSIKQLTLVAATVLPVTYASFQHPQQYVWLATNSSHSSKKCSHRFMQLQMINYIRHVLMNSSRKFAQPIKTLFLIHLQSNFQLFFDRIIYAMLTVVALLQSSQILGTFHPQRQNLSAATSLSVCRWKWKLLINAFLWWCLFVNILQHHIWKYIQFWIAFHSSYHPSLNVSLCKFPRNKRHHRKVLLKQFHLQASNRRISSTDSKVRRLNPASVKSLKSQFFKHWKITWRTVSLRCPPHQTGA